MSEWMLWGRFGGSVQLGSAPPPRLYFIPLTTSIEHEGPLAFQLGHQNRDERTLEGFTRALDRAVAAESDGVIFPSSFLTLSFRHEVIARCQNRKLRIVHQVTTDALLTPGASDRLDELLRRLDGGDALNLVFGSHALPKDTLLARLTRWPEQVYFTYSVRKSDAVLETLHLLQPFVRERLFFHFPFHTAFSDGHLSCQKVFDLTEKIRDRVPGIVVRPMLGTEMFDPRVDPSLELEPQHSPSIELRSNGGLDHKNRVPIQVSVIIPSYNNRDYLVNTIKHLARQNYSTSGFEIVVVDDGSTDGTADAVRQTMQQFEGQLNFKYIYSPRAKPRKMGDANYRAGISRNLGAKHALGKIFCFLDSDILTPPHFIADLIEKHKSYDVIQCKRLNLVREKSDANIRYDEINPAQDTFTTEDGYWEKFYALKNWSKTPFFWKYTCTYGLSVSAQLFKRVGWIRRGFVFYGFEDVEFGYRLAKVGARFHLNDMVTYHLFHRNERSEFHNSDYLRQSLLAKTAQIFFLNLLEPDIFIHFRGLMKEQLPISGLLTAGLRKLGLARAADRVSEATKKIAQDKRIRKYLGFLQFPFLAVWNWRWFLWRQWNRVKAQAWILKMPLVWTKVVLIRLGFRIENWTSKIKSLSDWFLGQTWRLRVLASRVFKALQLWRLRVLAIAVWEQRWRISVVAERISNTLQLWRLRVYTEKVLSHRWRLRVVQVHAKIVGLRLVGQIRRILSYLQLWRLRVAWENLLSQRWRIRATLEKIFPQYWRIRAAFRNLLSQRWRLRVAWENLLSQSWRIRVALGNLLSQRWRLRVAWENLLSQSWRIRVLIERLVGFWRKLNSQTWRLKVALLRFSGETRSAFYLSKSFTFSFLRLVTYPIRKLYYAGSYQWNKRIRGKIEDTGKQS